MEVDRLAIPDLLRLRPKRFADDRGYFSETWRRDRLAEAGVTCEFVQDNLSCSTFAGTVRGLHYQRPPFAQAKLVQVARGRILDVAVDARRGSPHYGKHLAVELSAQTGDQLFVPAGFLHGFATLEPDTVVIYKVNAYYDAASDGSVRWNDPALGIEWPVSAAQARLSEKDAAAPLFAAFESPFTYSGDHA